MVPADHQAEWEAVTPFDYAGVPADKVQDVRDASARIKVRMSRTAQDIIEIGRDLIAVKAKIGHGNFLPWIAAEFGMSRMTADRFINAAENLGAECNTVLHLPPTILYALAAPSTPEPVREQAIERAKVGETITQAEVREPVRAPRRHRPSSGPCRSG